MKKKQRRTPKNLIYRFITFFLSIPLFLNIIGNFIGIAWPYTFYYLGYNSVAILSRLIEDSVMQLGLRVFLLGMLTLVASAFFYFLYHHATKKNWPIFVVTTFLYIIDFALGFTPLYMEDARGLAISTFIHLALFAYLFVMLLALVLVNPTRNKEYDYA